jgi:hypothetical protein
MDWLLQETKAYKYFFNKLDLVNLLHEGLATVLEPYQTGTIERTYSFSERAVLAEGRVRVLGYSYCGGVSDATIAIQSTYFLSTQ